MKTDVVFSNKSEEWETPQDLFDRYNKEYNFDIDLCATKENTKCACYFTKEQDALSQEWSGVCWMNPPYGRQIGRWIKKAYESARTGKATVVCLLPARTDTAWFHDYAMKGEIKFIRKRLKFANSKNNAPFPSVIVIFKKGG